MSLPNILRLDVLSAAISGGTGGGLTTAVATVDLASTPFPFFNSGCRAQQCVSVCPPGPHLVYVYRLSLYLLCEVRVEDVGSCVRCVDDNRVVPGFPVRWSLLLIIHF